jgi:hypothetical protein
MGENIQIRFAKRDEGHSRPCCHTRNNAGIQLIESPGGDPKFISKQQGYSLLVLFMDFINGFFDNLLKLIVRTTDGVISIIPLMSQITLGVFPGIDFHHFPLSFGGILSMPSLILIISHI